MIEDDDFCDICGKEESQWHPHGSIVTYCDECWLNRLQETKDTCSGCGDEFLAGELCYDNCQHYTYWCKPCQIERFSEMFGRTCYEEDVITQYEQFIGLLKTRPPKKK